jgi:hypothetical protein
MAAEASDFCRYASNRSEAPHMPEVDSVFLER